MSPYRRWTLLVLAVALFTLGLMISLPETASALPQNNALCKYYSDDTYTTLVGECWITCTGVSCTGTKTAYKVCWQGNSCYSIPPRCSDAPWCDPYWETCCCEVYHFPC